MRKLQFDFNAYPGCFDEFANHMIKSDEERPLEYKEWLDTALAWLQCRFNEKFEHSSGMYFVVFDTDEEMVAFKLKNS